MRLRTPRTVPGRSARAAVEALEPRSLLSAATAAVATVEPNIVRAALAPAATGGTVEGFTPAQVRKAYGFDKVVLAGRSVAANGAGQTIAIVDAYHDPNLASDLRTFDAQFNLPDAALTIVNQTGGSRLPAADEGWAGEIALDVEWAHAIAPAAKILLVEASSDNTDDLMAAVDYARRADGVSVVSMSWGGSEYFSWGGSESDAQLQYDKTFTTPAGHRGVTFVAAAGDSGQSGGVLWPSSSPNVISVGGTNLDTSDAAGTYASEGAWRGFRSGTNGGFSKVEPEPAYQQAVQQTGSRSAPDVGYNADPNTGFAVYDTYGGTGWSVIGGTSAGSPQWAALVAIADQGRVLNGLGTLDGATETLPGLYSLYSAPGTAGYATKYTAAFHDIGDDGYGYTTGLGSPHADVIVKALAGTPAATGGTTGGTGSSGDGGDTGGGSGGTTITTPPAPAAPSVSPVSVAFAGAPASGIGGGKGSLKLVLTNDGGSTFAGPVTVTLYASTDGSVSTDDATVTTVSVSNLRLRAGASKSVKAKFLFPAGLADGSYTLIASAAATASSTTPTQATTPVAIAAPRVDLSTAFASDTPIVVGDGRSTTVRVTVANLGNVAATGSATLGIYGSADGALDGADPLLATLHLNHLRLKPGQSKTLKVKLKSVDLAAVTDLIASLSPATTPGDADATDNVAVAVLG